MSSPEEEHFHPLAASTAARHDRNPCVQPTVKGGSFLDVDSSFLTSDDIPSQQHQLRLSFSAFDQSPKISPREVTASRSLETAVKTQEPHETWSGLEQFSDTKKDDQEITSRNSSLGLLKIDDMSDLSSSVFAVHTSPPNAVEEVQPSQRSHSSSSRSHSDSKNWLRPDIDTVKKKPCLMPAPEGQGEVRQSLVFTEAMLGGENDADVTLPEIQFMEDELNQLDADFSYFDEVGGSESAEDTPEKKANGVVEKVRQSAEGDEVISPVPGGGGGDGSSGSDNENQSLSPRQPSQAQEFLEQFQPSFHLLQDQNTQRPDPQEQRVRPMGDDLLTEKGINRYSIYQGTRSETGENLLESRYLTSQPATDMTTMVSCIGLDNSTFQLDDLLQSPTNNMQGDGTKEESPGDRLEASGFNADDVQHDQPPGESPFGLLNNFSSSFGSFGASPDPDRAKESVENSGWNEMHSSPLSHRTSNNSRPPGSPLLRLSGNSVPDQPLFGSFDLPVPSAGEPAASRRIADENEGDDVVSDLADQSSVLKEVDQQKKELVTHGFDLQSQMGLTFTDQDFFTSGDGENMLDNDEKKFQEENVFMEEEVCVSNGDPAQEESWAIHSKMSLPCPSSLQGSQDNSRISVGTFIKSRSGALGSLDGAPIERPEFGMACKTPPENRKLIPLLDIEDDGSNRTAGVGNDEGDETLIDQSELTLSELAATNGKPGTSADQQDLSADHSTNESSTALSISEISQAIAKMSESATPEELAQMIMALSSKRKGSKPDGEEKVNVGSANVPSQKDVIWCCPRQSLAPSSRSSDPQQQERIRSRTDLFSIPQVTGRDVFRDDQPADGQASHTELLVQTSQNSYQGQSSTVVQSHNSPSVPRNGQTSEHLHELPTTLTLEKSPCSSASGLTGHHIPDGTEYSFQADKGHVRNTGRSREDLVGTADIQLADSRGFDLINSREPVPNRQNYRQNSFHHDLCTSLKEPDVLVEKGIVSKGRNDDSTQQQSFIPQKNNEKAYERDGFIDVPPDSFTQLSISDTLYSLQQSREWHSSDLLKEGKPSDITDRLAIPMPQPSRGGVTDTNIPDKDDCVAASATLSGSRGMVDFVREQGHLERLGRITSNTEPHRNHLDTIAMPTDVWSNKQVKEVGTNTSLLLTSRSLFSTSIISRHPDTHNRCKPAPSKGLVPVDAPSILEFTSVCCVGISCKAVLPMTNPTGRWLECQLQVQKLTIDGHPVSCDANFVFEMKSKVIVEPRSTEDISVIFIPKFPGVYEAQLNISSQLFLRDKDTEMQSVVTTIMILAEAEKPQIQVVSGGHRHLDFGHVSWGSTSDVSLSIVNEGKAMVPLRLAITTNKRPWHCFAFDQRNSVADISVISRSSRPQSQALGNTVITMCLPGRKNGQPNDPREIRIYCRPPDKQCDKGMAQLPPDEMTARVDVEVDTPSSHLPALFSLKLSAVVGIPKLRINRGLDSIQLLAQVGKHASQIVPLKNAGNINLELMLSTADFADAFVVTPKRLVIPPGQQAEATVRFLPTSDATPEFQTALLMAMLPDGPDYEVSVVGKLVKQQRQIPPILADRLFVCYGGVAVGQTVHKTVTLLNKSDTACRVRMEIQSNSRDFQLQAIFSSERKDISTRSRDVIMKPMEKYPVHVLFSPSSVCESTGKLVFKFSMSTFKYSIPLSGYGGISNVIIEGAKASEKDKYWLEMGEMCVGQCIVKRVTLRNIGRRPAYIRSVCCTDMRCKQSLAPGRVLVEPNEFVLDAQATTNVVMMLNPTDRESALCMDHKDMIGVVCFLCGDEISRQKMRAAIDQGRPSKPLKTTEDLLLKPVRFCSHYVDEESVTYTPTDQKSGSPQTDIDLFYSNMQRVMVLLMGQPQRSAMESMTVTPPICRTSRTADVQDPQICRTSRISDIQDPQICRTKRAADVQDPQKCKTGRTADVQDPQIFKTSRAADILDPYFSYTSIGPVKDTVQNRSSSCVCPSPSPAVFQNFDQLPRSDTVCVSCDKQCKRLPVRIQNDSILDGSSEANSNNLVPLTTTSAIATPLVIFGLPVHDKSTGIHIPTTTIPFPPTKVGEQSVSCINLTNRYKNSIKWILSSFAPPYVKGADSSRDVFRATYKVFEFTKKYGQIGAHKDAKLEVQFVPRSKGMFSQHWEIQSSESSGNSNSQTVRVQLCGEGLEKEKSSLPGTVNSESTPGTIQATQTNRGQKESTRSASTGAKEGESLMDRRESQTRSWASQRFDKELKPVVLKEKTNDIHFPNCRPKYTVQCKVHLKNESKTLHSVEIAQPSLPFRISHTNISIRPRSFLRLPVLFSPQKPGHYKENLVMKVDVGYTLTIRLEGHCT